ncbi:helix-turn-helix domain-containing protein [Paraburkholderia sp. GAS32]|uniref:helix-turn-helix domain-containing protein n=1 Tax=Paraburkholderia sp. GAS32 TaxID=3035129 RepID=UPI003D1FB0B3
MTAFFFDMSAITGNTHRSPRTGRAAERYSHVCLRALDARNEAAMQSIGGGSAPAPVRAPRKSPGTARAKKADSGGESDGDSERLQSIVGVTTQGERIARADSPGRKKSAALVVPKLYRISDVMEQLSVSRATLYRLVSTGKLRLVKVGSASRITAESIDALVAGNA